MLKHRSVFLRLLSLKRREMNGVSEYAKDLNLYFGKLHVSACEKKKHSFIEYSSIFNELSIGFSSLKCDFFRR